VSPVKYEQGFYIPEDDNHHSQRSENFKCYVCGEIHVPADLHRRKNTRDPLHQSLRGLISRTGRCGEEKILDPLWTRTPTPR
jgi:hypothetical protein